MKFELRLSYRNKPCRQAVGTCHVPFTKNEATDRGVFSPAALLSLFFFSVTETLDEFRY